MATYENILQAIGQTPLVRLNRVTANVQSPIYAKVEYLNPGGSTKDRIALSMIENAEKTGQIQPGGTIIEATAGNTGVGLALIAAVKKYRCIFVMPDKMSQDKINLLKAYGAEVVVTPTSVPPDSPESYNGVAERLAKEIPGAYRPNQFENPNNPLAHYLTTGPEIWADSQGKIDVFVAGMGTGGTISGVAKYLKEQNPNIIIVGADPEGSILSGDSPKSYKVEGIGEDFIPKTFNRQLVDEMIRVSDKESFNMARRLAREEGLLVGGSCGTVVAAALKYAARLSQPKYIVVLLPDTGRNYINKIYSDVWMQENGFWEGKTVKTIKVGEILQQKTDFPSLVAVSPSDTLSQATNLLQKLNISQLPVIDNHHVVGSLNEASLMKFLYDGINFSNQQVLAVMGKPLPILDENVDVSEAYRVLLSGTTGIIITRNNIPAGLITRADLIRYWISQNQEKSKVNNGI
ncbi:cystathionine beta-synthase [Trichormus variabilis ATCC 29413]|uniref:Cystathionine beta-synthase n=2 Tax=Anabaena variabilis TaxID=264691 RepID=Q3M5I1_TRIV2|nr:MULTISPECIES: cystathionine beta-synthase [Nostocaceae]ABA23755.1 cystathionine beta-synthase [Trichormus variabilis ATCC 29413]MBC1213562.1 cystathionine beta-synthase [Trichormus variabilis ARAD]MBC1253913.1 cystathionine beta-synthase [Trichormus variabilis V5]MBC1265856.1 cystathionine beta-synthase [Trichormus variabilis FSR]MBC1300359.1 cystathionine beta-synthase [Trichormus variabilis N2B]